MSFDATGYVFLLLNDVFTAANAVVIKSVLDAKVFAIVSDVSELSAVWDCKEARRGRRLLERRSYCLFVCLFFEATFCSNSGRCFSLTLTMQSIQRLPEDFAYAPFVGRDDTSSSLRISFVCIKSIGF